MLRKYHDLTKLSVKELIEIALQIDVGIYGNLPKAWQNPGMAGLCTFRFLADELSAVKSELSAESLKFLETIDAKTEIAINKLKINPQAFVKSDMNDLYEYAGGFERGVYSDERYQPIKKALEEAKLDDKGQLVYRIKDGRFFVLVDDRYLNESLKQYGNLDDKPTAEMGHAHFTVNDGMDKKESEEIYNKLQGLGKCEKPLVDCKIPGIVSINRQIEFVIDGAYEGIVKTNSRFAKSHQLTVKSADLDKLKAEYNLEPKLKDFWPHITFAEKRRVAHPMLKEMGMISEKLDETNKISKAVRNLISEKPVSAFERGMFTGSAHAQVVAPVPVAAPTLEIKR